MMFRTRTIPLLTATAFAAALAGMAAVTVRDARSAVESPTDLAGELTSTGVDDTSAATVNGRAITVGQVLAYESLSAQNQRLSGAARASRAEIVDGLIADELLFQEAARRGLHASEKEATDAMTAARAASDPKQLEYVLAYTSRATGQTLDADDYWALPQILAGYQRSLTVHRLIEMIAAAAPQDGRDAALAAETARLRAAASITISPEFR